MSLVNMAINPFDGGRFGKSPERSSELIINRDPLVEQTFEVYYNLDPPKSLEYQEAYISQLELEVLTPAQIEVVMQKIIDCGRKKLSESGGLSSTGLFLTRLIQDSYDVGHNHFSLKTRDMPLNCLGYKLKGSLGRELELRIMGNAKSQMGSGARLTIFTVEGSVENSCGSDAKQCLFNIEGNVYDYCAFKSEQSTFNIGGNVRDYCAFKSEQNIFNIGGSVGVACGALSRYNSFEVKGSVGEGFGLLSSNSEYYSPNKETYEKMKSMISEDNTINYGSK